MNICPGCSADLDGGDHRYFCKIAQQEEINEITAPYRERIAQLETLIREGADALEYAAQYKGEYLAEKHGDDELVARMRAALNAGARREG